MKTIMFFSLAIFAFNGIAKAGTEPDTTLNILDKGIIVQKMIEGQNKLYAGQYREALNTFREVLSEDKNHAMAHYRIAECHFALMNFDIAKEYIDKALKFDANVSKESEYLHGKILHRVEKPDEAIAALEKFKATLTPQKLKEFDVDYYITQCKTAKDMMTKPLSIEIVNAGLMVNSRHDDYSPLLSPDGKTLYITSRRAQSTGGLTTEDDDFFEDIYFCTMKEDGTWGEAEPVEGKLNTDEFDNCGWLSPDGTTMYVTQNISKYTKSSDIAVAKMSKSGKFGSAKLLPKGVNTTYFDACPALSADEKTMYFVSERNGEKAGSDVFKTTKSGSKWSEPIPVTNINSEYSETTVFLHPSGKYLFFSSKGHNGMGGYDIYVTEWNGTNWGAPKNLGYPFNTVNDDTHFMISPDGKYAYFASVRANGVGDRDIYVVDVSGITSW